MKKVCVNLLKVGVLLIMGLCIFGTMSQVEASTLRVKEEKLFLEETVHMEKNSEIVLNPTKTI